MRKNPFAAFESAPENFLVELKSSLHGFRKGDVLVCKYSKNLTPSMTAILKSPGCGRWPIPGDCCLPEIQAGARLIGYAICLNRNLPTGEEA
jgi:hypothetical protein